MLVWQRPSCNSSLHCLATSKRLYLMPPLGNKIKKKPQVRNLWGNGFEDKIIENLKSETIKALHPSSISTWYIDSYRHNNIKAPFTSHPQIPCFYRHSRQKGEGWRVKSHSCFRKKSVIKIFPNTYHLYLYIKPLLTFSIKRKIREQNAKQIFMSHQVCNVPKEGHFCAEVRALLCSGKSTFVPPRNTKVRK